MRTKIPGSVGRSKGALVSDQAWQASWNLAVTASAAAAVACIGTWATDFRADLPEIDVSMMVLHGDADLTFIRLVRTPFLAT